MRKELIVKSRSLAGTSDLTLLAPIKKGLVPSLESVTYKTRIKRLLQALHTGRGSAQEYALLRPFSDAVERVGRIHSVRVTVLEPEDKVLLAVTFDGTWEAYIRVLWQKVGPLLDIIFFDTEDYASAYDGRFEEWEAWARRVQVETHFFYGMPFLTVDDVKLLRNEEMLHRADPHAIASDLRATGQRAPTAEETAWQAAANTSGQASLETFKQGLEALSGLYRLTDLYLPDTEDGQYLQRAVRDLLLEFVRLRRENEIPALAVQEAKFRFERQLAWLDRALLPPKNPRRVAPPLPTAEPEFDRADVQGGIVDVYQGATHGALLMLGIAEPRRALPFFDALLKQVSRASTLSLAPGQEVLNVAFSHEGLRVAGLLEDELALFPEEFRQGMEARASMLGDVRGNHPRRWKLPARWDGGAEERVELSAVHVVLTLRVGCKDARPWGHPKEAGHPLNPALLRWMQLAEGSGVTLLAVQPMQRYTNEKGRVVEHFGFVDGTSDPSIKPVPAKIYPNQVHLGELLLGYENEADWPPEPAQRRDPALEERRLGWLKNGSFLVVRKLAQDLERLEELLEQAERDKGVSPEELLAKMMGRYRNGKPLALEGGDFPEEFNDYDYSHDPHGAACPLHAHVRRANPRKTAQELNQPLGRRTPRIARRGMPYGPPHTPQTAGEERGLVFMAYNASIAEQFETIQGWLAGGNSSGGFSGESDPFLGVPDNGSRRWFRFAHKDGQEPRVVSVPLDGCEEALGDRRPLIRLEWGSYLFTPAVSVLRRLRDRVAQAGAAPELAWSADEGQALIEQLQARCAGLDEAAAIELWKAALEDPIELEKFRAAGIWAAIRERHGGVLRTPYGVLVGDRELVLQVLCDEQVYSVRGYQDRLAASIGDIYLGQDAAGHDKLSRATNAAIQALLPEPAYELTLGIARRVLDEFLSRAQAMPNPSEPQRWELILEVREVIEKVLGQLCWWWFGMPQKDTADVKLSGARWDADPGRALYPGHFTAPSRFVFQPWPGQAAQRFGRDYGRTLTAAFVRFAQATTEKGAWPLPDPGGHPAPVAKAIWEQFKLPRPDHEAIAHMLVGAMMGMLPTVDGNLRRSINEWLYDGSFWSLRAAWQARPGEARSYADALQLLARPLHAAMQLRPSPEMVWRTALGEAALGGVTVRHGDKVVASLASAAQQCLARGDADVSMIFGGDRSQPGHPPHACPAYRAAMGVLLGFAAALLERPEAMRPAVVPLALVFDGPMPDRASHPPEDDAVQAAARRAELAARLATPGAAS